MQYLLKNDHIDMIFDLLERHTPSASPEYFFMKFGQIFNFLWRFEKHVDFQMSSSLTMFRTLKNYQICCKNQVEAWKWENNHLCTFVAIKIDSHVLLQPRFFLRIPTDPQKFPEANVELWYHLKKVFAHFKSNSHICSSVLCDALEAILATNGT